MSDTSTTPYTVSDDDAKMLAQHAIYVQGGFSTPEREAERFVQDVARGLDPEPALAKMREELRAEMLARLAALGDAEPEPAAPAPEPAAAPEPSGPQSVDVTSVMPDIDSAIALRARIKALRHDLDAHEKAVKDVLGNAVEGVDSTGKVIVTQPIRNRTNFDKKEAAKRMSPEDFAACETHTTYRPLLFDGD